MLFSTYSHPLKWVRSSGFFFSRISLVVAQASAICLNCLHRLPNLFVVGVDPCALLSVKKPRLLTFWWVRSDKIMCWARAQSSSSELVDTATARRRRRVEDATRVGLQFLFAQNDEAEEHRAPP